MDARDTIYHLLSFSAPAFAVATLVALGASALAPRRPGGYAWWLHAAINSVAGVLVLVAGLWFYGVDGKMATYAALVFAVATCQWLCGGARRA